MCDVLITANIVLVLVCSGFVFAVELFTSKNNPNTLTFAADGGPVVCLGPRDVWSAGGRGCLVLVGGAAWPWGAAGGPGGGQHDSNQVYNVESFTPSVAVVVVKATDTTAMTTRFKKKKEKRSSRPICHITISISS